MINGIGGGNSSYTNGLTPGASVAKDVISPPQSQSVLQPPPTGNGMMPPAAVEALKSFVLPAQVYPQLSSSTLQGLNKFASFQDNTQTEIDKTLDELGIAPDQRQYISQKAFNLLG